MYPHQKLYILENYSTLLLLSIEDILLLSFSALIQKIITSLDQAVKESGTI